MEQEFIHPPQKSSIRCRIMSPDLPADYFCQPISFAYEASTLYLRIGDDIYEGQQVKNSCEGANIHFCLDPRQLSSSDDRAGDLLSRLAVTNKEYVFWPAGNMRRAQPDQAAASSDSVVEDDVVHGNESEEALLPVLELLGLQDPTENP